MAGRFGEPSTSLHACRLSSTFPRLLHAETLPAKPSSNASKALVVLGSAFCFLCHTSAGQQCPFVHVTYNLVIMGMQRAVWCYPDSNAREDAHSPSPVAEYCFGVSHRAVVWCGSFSGRCFLASVLTQQSSQHYLPLARG